MKIEEATRLLDEGLRHTVEDSDIFAEAMDQAHQGGFSLQGITFHLIIASVEAEPAKEVQSDAEFLRELHIDPNLTLGVVRSVASRRRRKRAERGR